MKNVTISMDEELYATTRVEAAKVGKSMSRYIADATKAKINADEKSKTASVRNHELEALQRFLAGPDLNISEAGRMPSAEERNSRGWQRDIR